MFGTELVVRLVNTSLRGCAAGARTYLLRLRGGVSWLTQHKTGTCRLNLHDSAGIVARMTDTAGVIALK